MNLIAQFPLLAKDAGPEVTETAEVMSRLLKLQHCPPTKALLALTLVADSILPTREDIEALKLKASIRGLAASEELVRSEGGVLSAEAFGERVGVSRETVNQWRQQGRVLGWKRGARNFAYPAWQIHRGALLPGLDQVLACLAPRGFAALDVADYLLSESEELNGRPLDLLRRGLIDAVLEHARRHGDIGA